MYWIGNWRGREEKVYEDGREYGVRCHPQDLNELIKILTAT